MAATHTLIRVIYLYLLMGLTIGLLAWGIISTTMTVVRHLAGGYDQSPIYPTISSTSYIAPGTEATMAEDRQKLEAYDREQRAYYDAQEKVQPQVDLAKGLSMIAIGFIGMFLTGVALKETQ